MKICKNNNLGFNKIKIRDICNVKTGKRNANEQSKDGIYPFFTCGKKDSKADFYDFDCEAILVSGNGNVGLSKYYEGKFTAYQRTYVIKDFGDYDAKYIYYYFKYLFLPAIERNIQGGVINYIKIGDILDFEINYPNTHASAKLISKKLLNRESYLQSIQTLISKMEQRNQYYLNETLKSEGFVKTNLGELCTIKTGKLNANASSEGGKYPFFTCSRNISRIDDYAFDQEAILVAGNGVVGEIKYYEGKFNAYQRTYVLGDFKIPAKYIFHYMKAFFQKRIEREVQGGVISYIKIDNIKDFEIHYPEDEDKLNETLEFIESNERELELVKQLYSKEKQVFQWLCEKIVSGEYRIDY